MADFSDQTKLRVVLALARFERPSEILAELKDEGIEASIQQICGYDPSRPAYQGGEKWVKFFDDERASYIAEVSSVPIANQGYRLRRLQRLHDGADKAGNRVLAATLLRQAAEEVGGALTNERNVKVTRPVDELTPDERRSTFAELIRKAMETKDPAGTMPAPTATQ